LSFSFAAHQRKKEKEEDKRKIKEEKTKKRFRCYFVCMPEWGEETGRGLHCDFADNSKGEEGSQNKKKKKGIGSQTCFRSMGAAA
jgi:hypothetical protein